jgi:hypothetical protein
MLDASGLRVFTGLWGTGDGDLLLNVFLILDSDRCLVNLRGPLSGVSIVSCGFFSSVGAGAGSTLNDHGRNFDRVGIVN